MALKSITMTKEQTSSYDSGGQQAEALMADLREQAEAQITGDDMVEIYTADGIVADYIESEANTDSHVSISGGEEEMTDKFPMPLTAEELWKMMERFQAENPDRAPVAAVARPDYYQAVAIICKSEPSPDSKMAYGFGLRVYCDAQQKEPWKLFYEWEELNAYLNRAAGIAREKE